MDGEEGKAAGGKPFAAALAAARAAAGFPTAYKFYHNNGGRRHFPFTYAYYARFERGAALPRPGWLAAILTAMRVAIGEDGHRTLMRAYLVDLLGGEETYHLVMGPITPSESAGPVPLGREALRWMKAHHAVHLTPGQFRAVASDETAYWCSEALLNDSGAWDAEELAKVLDLPRKAVSAALQRLKSAGLAVAAPGGKVRGRWAGKLYTFPGRLSGMDGSLRRVKGYWERMERRRGAPFAERVELVRAGADGMRRYWRELGETLDGANAHGVHRPVPDSGLFVIEARVRRLTPF
jgi:DNA-binding transcriptional ArsR family regulator